MLGHRYSLLIIVLGITTLVWGGFLFFDREATLPQQSRVSFPSDLSQMETAAILRKAEVGLPLHIIIPSITVNANIVYVGLTKKGAIDVPKGPKEVAWFNLGPRPGEAGTAILVGHYGPWIDGTHSVFSNLDKLKRGDKIYVQDGKGKMLTFTVKGSRTYDQYSTAPEVFAQSKGSHLNIITCNGDWIRSQQTYDKRLVIFTDLEA